MRYHAIYQCSRYKLSQLLMKDVGVVERLRMIEIQEPSVDKLTGIQLHG